MVSHPHSPTQLGLETAEFPKCPRVARHRWCQRHHWHFLFLVILLHSTGCSIDPSESWCHNETVFISGAYRQVPIFDLLYSRSRSLSPHLTPVCAMYDFFVFPIGYDHCFAKAGIRQWNPTKKREGTSHPIGSGWPFKRQFKDCSPSPARNPHNTCSTLNEDPETNTLHGWLTHSNIFGDSFHMESRCCGRIPPSRSNPFFSATWMSWIRRTWRCWRRGIAWICELGRHYIL